LPNNLELKNSKNGLLKIIFSIKNFFAASIIASVFANIFFISLMIDLIKMFVYLFKNMLLCKSVSMTQLLFFLLNGKIKK
jgi:hypothetical protein